MDINVQKQLVDRLRSRYDDSIAIEDESSEIAYRVSTAIRLNPNLSYKVGLVFFGVFNLPRLINSTNNNFRYSKDSGATWKTGIIPPGAYDIDDLNSAIQTILTANGDWIDNAIVIEVINAVAKFVIKLASGYQVDFTINNSLGSILGFNSRIISSSSNTADTIGNIQAGVNSINIKTDISFGGLVGNSTTKTLERKGIIYSIPLFIQPIGGYIAEAPLNPIYYPLSVNRIENIYIRVEDWNGKLIDFGGEKILILLHIKQS